MNASELNGAPIPVSELLSSANQERFLDQVVDAIPCMVFVKRASDLTYLFVNRVARDALGLTDAAQGKSDLELFPKKEAMRVRADDRAVLASGVIGPIVQELRETVTGPRWFGTQKVPIAGANSTDDALFTFSEDITAQKELLSTAAMWDQVFHHSEEAMVIGRPDGRVIELMNSALAEMYGSTIDEMQGTPIITLFAVRSRNSVKAMLEVGIQNGQHTFEALGRRRDGASFPVLVDATSVRDARGNVSHRAIRIQDRTVLKSREHALQADRIHAEKVSEAKSDFLSRMSHELRTPLNVILGFGQVLQLDELTEIQTESVANILQAGRHLLALIDETLDISQVESGHVALLLQSVDLTEVINEVLGLMQPLADAAEVVLVHGSPATAGDCHAIADRQRLKQILLNLVTNGINYNVPGGTLETSCRTVGDSVELVVVDSGIGIPEGMSERLFAPFDRLGQERGEVEGTGLGLSLSRSLVEAMGGTIAATRNADVGSTFTVTMKASAQSLEVSVRRDSALTESQGTNGLVLYIEGNLANFRLVEQVLARRPHVRVLPAMQARIGLQLARAHLPDMIILDLNLPDMGGEETLRNLLENPATRMIPVVIASADATSRRIKGLLGMGARAHLTKPIDVARLLATVDEFLTTDAMDNPGE